MKTIKLMAVLLPLCALVACGEKDAATNKAVARIWQLPVLSVQSGAPAEYSAVGTLVSDRRIEVASRLSGYLREITVQEGDQVRAGQVLARIDAVDVDSQIRQAEAGLNVAKAAAADALLDAQRYQKLFEKAVVSDSEMRKVQLRAGSTQEAVAQAEAALAAARAQQDYAQVRSPVAGEVVARLRRSGDLAVPGAAILVVEAAGELVFETTVPGAQLLQLRQGQAVNVWLDGLSVPRAGKVARIVSSGDAVTRAYPVRISLQDKAGLRSGMFGRAVFALGSVATPVIPRTALCERGSLQGVYVLDAKQRVYFRWLRLGREWPERVEVTAGLREGERFLAQVPKDVREGDFVSTSTTASTATSTAP